MRLSLVGISHHVAPVELRERVSLPLEAATALATRLGDAVCISTCNRTEVYLAGEDETRALASLEELAGEPLRSVAYRMHDEAAAVHLFRVSAGLDSLVPGESEILGQVRAAFDAASPGPPARQTGPHRDGDRREPGLRAFGGCRARRAGLR